MKKHGLTIAFFLLLLLGLGGTLLNLDATFSPAERRVLASFPKKSALSLQRWTWDDDIESYLSDHLALRNVLTGVSAYVRRFTGVERLDDIYVTSTGQLVERPVENTAENRSSLERNLRHLDGLAAGEGLTFSLLVPPSAGYAAREALPWYLRPLFADDQLLSELNGYEHLAPVDLLDALCAGAGDRFYRTDNHWNADGAYAAYAAYLTSRGREPLRAEAIVYETYDDFHGSTLSRSALWLTSHEPIRYPLPPCAYTVAIENEPPREDLYFREALTSHDPYAVFFNGNYGLVKLTSAAPDARGALLILKDSFANAVTPLLLPHYSTILLVDPRFYRGDLHGLMAAEAVDEVLCLCSLKTLVTDGTWRLIK